MFDFIPIQYRLIAVLIAGALLIAGAAAGGAKVATWKADAGFYRERLDGAKREADLNKEITDLKLSVSEANQSIAVAKAQSDAADSARVMAQKHADDLAEFSRSRLDKLEASFKTAKSCEDVLGQYWEIRK